MHKFAFTAFCIVAVMAVSTTEVLAMSGEEALQKLKEGNARFVADELENPNTGTGRRSETADHGQHPFATIIGCSDSRVPIEIVFDQGVGDLFIIRVAGNVCDVDEMGSIEYGIHHLHTPLFVVLGHSQCGAVTAVVTEAEIHGSIPELVDNINPAVDAAASEYPDLEGTELVPHAVEANVWQSIEDLFEGSPAARELVGDDSLLIVGAVYHLDSGEVEWLGEHPNQDALLGIGPTD